ncbi:hypothetical protein SDC9_198751 [bioreactor metagenome]|uniref:Uncharacterized protein n=1 Tax=bioreactor metagenome TaxID=1076179 RepID=A0A645IKW6_9ZZZZ
MNDTALVFSIRVNFSGSFKHTKALVAYYELYAVQAAALQPFEKLYPTDLVFFHALSSTEDFPITIFIYCNSHQDADVLKFATPVPA